MSFQVDLKNFKTEGVPENPTESQLYYQNKFVHV